MKVGLIGLGRMGEGMSRRMMKDGIEVWGYRRNYAKAQEAYEAGYVSGVAASLESLVQIVHEQEGMVGKAPGIFQLVIPAELVEDTLNELLPLLGDGDIIIDHGNSNFKDSRRRAERLDLRWASNILTAVLVVEFTVWSVDTVLWLVVQVAQYLSVPPFSAHSHLALPLQPRTDPYTRATSAEYGWLHCGGPGAGHFVKMVHNGVEYGIMQAYAEGFNILNHGNLGSKYVKEGDAEVAPMENPADYQYDIDTVEVDELWRRGSVVGSWLLDLTADVLRHDPNLDKFDGGVSDSGEGRWTLHSAVDLGVPTPVISAALFERFNSRRLGEYGNKILNGMRYMFGGHHVR